MGIVSIPFLLLPSHLLIKPARFWIGGIFLLLKYICKITHEIQGKNHIPNKPVLIASKHQSAFETFAIFYYMPNSIFIHKKQLFLIPIFGQYLKKINMISIDRNKGTTALKKIINETKSKIKDGYSIIIFPEGTRKKPGDPPDYKSGIFAIYNEAKVEILPVALNSGHFWPKHTFIKHPGHIIIKFLEIIPKEINKIDLLLKLEKEIEKETKKIAI